MMCFLSRQNLNTLSIDFLYWFHCLFHHKDHPSTAKTSVGCNVSVVSKHRFDEMDFGFEASHEFMKIRRRNAKCQECEAQQRASELHHQSATGFSHMLPLVLARAAVQGQDHRQRWWRDEGMGRMLDLGGLRTKRRLQ